MSKQKRDYEKPSLTYEGQVSLLRSRGLQIEDEKAAEDFLADVNYYRLDGYFDPFLETRNPETKYKKGASFEDITALYMFDQQLRQRVSEGLSVIEVYWKARIAYILAHIDGDQFAHENPKYFYRKEKHCEWVEAIHKETEYQTEEFVIAYKKKYNEFPRLPLWAAVELMSFGTLYTLFCSLEREYQKKISEALGGVDKHVLRSWLSAMKNIRNVCAHHKRLWNREIDEKYCPELPDAWNMFPSSVNPAKTGTIMYLMNHILRGIPSMKHFREQWRTDIGMLMSNAPHKHLIETGMEFQEKHGLWRY